MPANSTPKAPFGPLEIPPHCRDAPWGVSCRGGDRPEAQRLAEEALAITERCGYVLQGADVHLLLTRLDLEAGNEPEARRHAAEARRLATCDGPPDYTYKVAYEEAGRLLEQLGEG